jgi:hypothetical protein
MVHHVARRSSQPDRSNLLLLSALLVFLLAGCEIPGMIPTAHPTADADALATIIAGTAAAANAQTAAASPATASPPASTLETAAQAVTETPLSLFSAQGTALIPDENGSTLFIDQSVGCRFIPTGWLLVRIGEPEMSEAFNGRKLQTRVWNFLDQANRSDPKSFRLFSVDRFPNISRAVLTNLMFSDQAVMARWDS